MKFHRLLALIFAAAAIVIGSDTRVAGQKPDEFRFRSGVDLVNVTATVTDRNGRFVGGLRQEDFIVYENDELQSVTHFSNDRVPVSLGMVVDTSGSMSGEKMDSAQAAIDRFLTKLLDPADEIFLYRFREYPELLQDWTTDRSRLSRAIRRLNPNGGTAMYDAVGEAVPMAQTGTHRKKAVLLISDGNDQDSTTNVSQLKQMIRESEVLVYAIGIDGHGETSILGLPPANPPTRIPVPFPGSRRPPRLPGGIMLPYQWPFPVPQGRTGRTVRNVDDRVNVGALREITDDSGGRTEIVRSARDLEPATANIADELSRQYYLGYSSTTEKDGRWHTIRVETRDRSLRVRARRGYVATP